MSDERERPGRYQPGQQLPPPQRITDSVVMRFEHIYEVEPSLMRDFAQQEMPGWDTKRIAAARMQHLDDIHAQFADGIVLAGEGPDTDE